MIHLFTHCFVDCNEISQAKDYRKRFFFLQCAPARYNNAIEKQYVLHEKAVQLSHEEIMVYLPREI